MNLAVDFSVTDVAAWWGAVVATVVLAWDVYKWRRRGAQIQVTAAPNMRVLNVPGISENEIFVSVTVHNTGDQASTVTSLLGVYYEGVARHLLRRAGMSFVVINPAFGPGLPSKLEPGGVWEGGILQSELVEKIGPSGRLYCGVSTSTSKKPHLVRVRISKASE